MKIIICNSEVKFRNNNVVTNTLRFGNDSEGIVLRSYIRDSGEIYTFTSGTYANAVSPLVDITGLIGNIKLNNYIKMDTTGIAAAFYGSDGVTVVGVHAADGDTSKDMGVILNENVPTEAKYIRFNIKNGSSVASTSDGAGLIEFKVKA